MNKIICGDCIDWLEKIPAESVDVCYIDPPFYSNKPHEFIWKNGYEKRAYDDRWAGGMTHYIGWMKKRVERIKPTLKKTGSIFLHCDWRASHRLRLMLDEVFGAKNFVNEIICMSDLTGCPPARYFQINTQTVFWYSKSKHYKYVEDQMRKKTRFPKDSDHGFKTYSSGVVGYDMPPGNYKEKTLREKEKNGLAFKNKKGNWRVIKAVSDGGKDWIRDDKMTNLWDDLPRMAHLKAEKRDYPTQKPEALIERIISCSTNEGDVVLDCFGGGGTTATVAAKLKRQFITGDVSPVAVRVMSDRLKELEPSPLFEIQGLPRSRAEWRAMNGHEFAERICRLKGWECNQRKSGDGGIDGWFDNRRVAVQIKNSERIGRVSIQQFFGALGKAEEGIFVAWSFTKTAQEYRAQVKLEHGKDITLMEVRKILGGLLISDEDAAQIEELYAPHSKAA